MADETATFGDLPDRVAVPAEVLESKEFRMDCCARAQCMRLRLERAGEEA